MTAPAAHRGRISRRSVQATRSRLSGRDLTVLRSVEKARLLTATQVERLVFTEGSERTRARRSRATLQRLTEARCLTRLDRRIGGLRAGSASYIYALAPFGQRVLRPGADRLRRVREPGRAFVDHVLATAELWVQLVETARTGDLDLISFDVEPKCWRSFARIGGERRWVKPDARVVVATGEWEHHWMVEVDLGTESGTVIRAKADAYIDYWRTGIEQDRGDVFPRVLFLVPDRQRRERITDALGRLPAEHWQLFQVGLLSEQVQTIRGRREATEQEGEQQHVIGGTNA